MGIFSMPETPGEMFQRYDVDKSGALDRTEVQFALADLGAPLRRLTTRP